MRPGRDAFPAKERETTHRKRQDVPVILSRQGGDAGASAPGDTVKGRKPFKPFSRRGGGAQEGSGGNLRQ